MKSHTKKKLYRSNIQRLAREGNINNPDGRMVARGGAKDDSMKRDYYPQRGGK